ncbi:MAG: pyruvate ferredoxin oxidoreductase [Actinomycetia bacterium]|nr:pyruvate ferredoxin oxidoreductase [Actinomycetes bacterium]
MNDPVPSAPTNVLIVGVGGQGVIMVSKVLARVLQLEGHEVKQSEVHGMAKRGGAVFSHVRYGPQVWSPTIPAGQADILVALEWAEGLRWLDYLRPDGGVFISDTRAIVPPFACRDRTLGASSAYRVTDVARVAELVPQVVALDASGLARELGNERVANTVLLGALSGVMDIPVESWESVIPEFVPPATIETNLRALHTGLTWEPDDDAHIGADSTPEGPVSGDFTVDLEINRAWCKSCDICVQLCPERCLTLDTDGIVEVTDASACTGCRICEWLCPDFAINVHVSSPKVDA